MNLIEMKNESGMRIVVNADNVASIVEIGDMTQINYSGGHADVVWMAINEVLKLLCPPKYLTQR